MSAFKSYDIRGVFGSDLTLDLVYRVGRCLPQLLTAKKFLVGRDARLSSPAVCEALLRGLTEAGADVDDMGLATTPMVYFFTAEKQYEGSVQITASHNPAHYNGLKVSKTEALPVGYDAGLKTVEAWLAAGTLPPKAEQIGTVRTVHFLEEYCAWLLKHKPDLSSLRFAVDCSDGMGALVAKALFGEQAIYLNDVPDGTFPHHAPNPLEVANCAQLIACVKSNHLDVGVIFDGDADRVMFVDHTGCFIQPDYLIPLIAERLSVPSEPRPITVIHDIRTSRGVIERLHEEGFKTYMGKVGHAYAKIALRQYGALCGGELAGHYYFRDFHFCDSGEWAALVVLGIVAEAKRRGESFAEQLDPIRSRYVNSGEINRTGVTDREAAIARVEQALVAQLGAPESRADFDGVRLDWANGWMSVRASNTEPVLRLLAEARTQAQLTTMLAIAQAAV
ncbi:MAG: phosphomannomutase/phosphoglucomutase [Kiritimatiellia bacterium]